jgi:arylformamidase
VPISQGLPVWPGDPPVRIEQISCIARGEEVNFLWEDRLPEFEPHFAYLEPKAAEWLVKRGLRLVGTDYLSVDASAEYDLRAHRALLGASVVIVEGLNLSRVPAGPCQLICLPLKIEGGDGVPARVLVIQD